MTVTLLTTVARDAARSRAAAVRARADRPSQRRSDEGARHARVSAPLSRAAVSGGGGPLVFEGFASVTGRAYEMWDAYGPYGELVAVGAFAATLARADLDVPLVIAHDQLRRIARTGNAASPLTLTEVADGETTGLHVLAPSLPADDADVQYIASKLASGLVDEMSFAFRIDQGRWSEDFTTYAIAAADLHRGDVAIVGYGANPFTSAALRTPDVSQAERLRVARLAVALSTTRA